MNVRGLRNDKKRKEMFIYFKNMQSDIICVQESHVESSIEAMWTNEWGGEILFSNDSSLARGVMIMFKPKLAVLINKVMIDTLGRFILADVTIDSQNFLIANVYAPN